MAPLAELLSDVRSIDLEKVAQALSLYQENPYLLDTQLNALLNPVLADFKRSHSDVLAQVIYLFCKVRGQKHISTLFPHSTNDFTLIAGVLGDKAKLEGRSWYYRYVLLLWLSLVVTLPFALPPNSHVQEIALRYLSYPGKERDAAVALLSRFEARNDTDLAGFVKLCVDHLEDPATSEHFALGLLATLSTVLITARPSALNDSFATLYRILALCPETAKGRKARVKLAGRMVLLKCKNGQEDAEEIDAMLEDLLEAVGDPDTVVRWSVAKYLARSSVALGASTADDIVGALLENVPADLVDRAISSKEEQRIHGSCLALAECARNGVLSGERVADTLKAATLALRFDRLRGLQAIGTPIRDASAYLIWSLSRTLSPKQVEGQANELAAALVAVSLFDRDRMIRRAASAAFQECVGRLGNFPSGIEVLGKIDWFGISSRKRAFTEIAPDVARIAEYRPLLLQRALYLVEKHYDRSIRQMAATSLGRMARDSPDAEFEDLLHRFTAQLSRPGKRDAGAAHGALWAVAELVRAGRGRAKEKEHGEAAWATLDHVVDASQPPTRTSPLLLEAACKVMAATSASAMASKDDKWWEILKLAMAKNDPALHTAAAEAFGALSSATHLGRQIKSLLGTLKETRMTMLPARRAAVEALGAVSHTGQNGELKNEVLSALLALLEPPSSQPPRPSSPPDIELKRNAVAALSKIESRSALASDATWSRCISAFMNGLDDYTTDQRGDVGSWMRVACIAALRDLGARQGFSEEEQARLVGAMVKLAAERPDAVREAAGLFLQSLAEDSPETGWATSIKSSWAVQEEWRASYLWSQATLLPLLGHSDLRTPLLEGLIAATTSAVIDVPTPAVEYLQDEQRIESGLTSTVAANATAIIRKSFGSNKTVVPALYLLTAVLSTEVLESIGAAEEGRRTLANLLDTVTRQLDKMKSTERLLASARLAANLAPHVPAALPRLAGFLQHSDADVRTQTADWLYASLSVARDIDDHTSDLLLGTDWADMVAARSAVASLVARR